ncbi:MAG: signal peptidase I [Flavobacteriaceae bacterium]
MSWTEWLLLFFFLNGVHFLSTWKLYQVAGKKAWEAAIPLYNALVLMEIIKRPRWWVLLLFIPIINLIVIPVVWVETLRSFGYHSTQDTLFVLFSGGLYIATKNYGHQLTYIPDRSLTPRTAFGEWISSVLFAVVAATLVHTYIMQPYIIPTGSLEKTLLVGDFLFVSKFHFGSRVPMTTISFPMVHDTLPLIKTRSYLKKPQLPYLRFPGIQKIKRNDIVVFSWPADTVRQFFVKEAGVRKPIDKKSNYVKRCVALPGDTLEIKNGLVFINGKQSQLPDRAKVQYTHKVYADKGVSARKLRDMGYKDFERVYKVQNITQQSFNALRPYLTRTRGSSVEDFRLVTASSGLPVSVVQDLRLSVTEILEREKQMTLTLKEAQELAGETWIDSITRKNQTEKVPNTQFFPNSLPYDWNEDNFGPVVLPKAGAAITLTSTNYPLYKKLIREYEKNQFIKKKDGFEINGQPTQQYTFKQDYYWMMGDNRHKSEDSRFWGFVPSDHIVGKPVFIWFSIEGFTEGIKNWRIRWDRVFTTVGLDGPPRSYFPHFLAFVVLWQVLGWVRKRKQRKTA